MTDVKIINQSWNLHRSNLVFNWREEYLEEVGPYNVTHTHEYSEMTYFLQAQWN